MTTPAPAQQQAGQPGQPPPQPRWRARRLALAAAIVGIIALAVVHALGPKSAATVGIITGCALVGLAVLWHLPRIRRHLGVSGRGRARQAQRRPPARRTAARPAGRPIGRSHGRAGHHRKPGAFASPRRRRAIGGVPYPGRRAMRRHHGPGRSAYRPPSRHRTLRHPFRGVPRSQAARRASRYGVGRRPGTARTPVRARTRRSVLRPWRHVPTRAARQAQRRAAARRYAAAQRRRSRQPAPPPTRRRPWTRRTGGPRVTRRRRLVTWGKRRLRLPAPVAARWLPHRQRAGRIVQRLRHWGQRRRLGLAITLTRHPRLRGRVARWVAPRPRRRNGPRLLPRPPLTARVPAATGHPAPANPGPAVPVRQGARHARTPGSPPPSGPAPTGATMSSPIAAVTDAVNTHIGGFQPENGEDLDRFLGDLGQFFDDLGSNFIHLADRLGSDFPVNPAVIEAIRELGANAAAQSGVATETYVSHRKEHETEMKRYEEPRPGEEMWDVRGA